MHLSVQGSAELVQAAGQGSLLFSILPWHPSLYSLQLLYQVTNCLQVLLYTQAPEGGEKGRAQAESAHYLSVARAQARRKGANSKSVTHERRRERRRHSLDLLFGADMQVLPRRNKPFTSKQRHFIFLSQY
jgi:hypothetical protein